MPAAALEIGSQVQRANGTTGIVEAIEFSYDSQLMYNLTVAAAHTYFVGDGQWLVHNACVKFNRSSLQHTFDRHKADWGFAGVNQNNEVLQQFQQILDTHIHSVHTQKIVNNYRGAPATFYFDSTTKLTVIADPAGDFISGWKFSPSQEWHLLNTGNVH